ncbi:MAG: methylenetetrahydrofolate--tRNA-(uracil(54)-C(5))-methyltransferase (FADH(2)-oxidizing) TrmFO [Thermoflexales bacterium]|nr:methylenetetrahydrofolate--tRNA-(uracil(54)-C(5))-methyltransferase (FADH(2)-oxidizing) TrmFO [Thermoflexales bacterium]
MGRNDTLSCLSGVDCAIVVGGGLAGCEAAWQIAESGLPVDLYEMRPARMTPAHTTDRLAELVCSNSLGSDIPDRAPGLLKAELRRLGSVIMQCADASALPAGGALAVDRQQFAGLVTDKITQHPRISLRRQELLELPATLAVVATGPLTSDALAADIARLAGQDALYFYDAMAPIVSADSIDLSVAFQASRYGKGQSEEGDYVNCPFTQAEYEAFVDALLSAQKAMLHAFEREDPHFFEGCLPVEEIARRGRDALAYGPLRPVGLRDPRTGQRPHAVVQLRRENAAGTLYNLVGFQTNLAWPEQKRVFRMIPGLERAEFVRYGVMHRNTFVNAPALLEPTLQCRRQPGLFFAGQLAGVEGYLGSTAAGWVAGFNLARLLKGQTVLSLPSTTMIGALCQYLSSAEAATFQPMKANFGLLPALEPRVRNKRARFAAYAERALAALDQFIDNAQLPHFVV